MFLASLVGDAEDGIGDGIESLYGKSIKAPQPAAPKGQGLGVGTRVKELERKGDEVKVRTMEGEERWVPASSL